MFKKLLYFFAIIMAAYSSSAQGPSYAFLATTGTYTPVTGGTVATINSGDFDDGFSNGLQLGFTFNYNGTNYTAISASANGWASFVNITSTTSSNNLTSFTNRPFLAPLFEDLSLGVNANLTYTTTGAAGSRVFTLQWANVLWDFNAAAPSISFQVKLYEGTNVIEFIYKQEAGVVQLNGSGGASIGITGATGSYLSLNNSGPAPIVSSTSETLDIATRPATGQIYRWSPFCTAGGTSLVDEKITNVTFNTINNNSTSTAIFENFTNIVTTVQPAFAVPISVSFSPLNVADQVVVFIDYNHNGLFTDAGETVFTSTIPAASGTVTGTVNIPAFSANVLAGVARMRVRLHNTGGTANATSCGTSQFGQVEDYNVDIEICNAVAITTQPPNTTICNGGTGTISLGTTGTGLTYQWQVSTNGGTSFTNIANGTLYSGTNTSTLIITGAAFSMAGYQYRAIVNGTCTPTNTVTGAAVLSINTPANITTQPVIVAACEKTSATFTAAASGTTPTYQWQVSTDAGITYTDIANEKTASLTLNNVTNAMNGNRYRVVATVTSCGSAGSNGAILTVNALPVISIDAAPIRSLRPGLTTILSAAVTPASSGNIFTWYKDGVVVTGATANTLLLNLGVTGIGKYVAKVTDTKGCTSLLSNELSVIDSSSNILFITPNPSTGIFQVRYYPSLVYAPGYFARNRYLNIYDMNGKRVLHRAVSVNNPYGPIDVNLSNESKGVYLVEIRDFYEKRLVTGKVLIH